MDHENPCNTLMFYDNEITKYWMVAALSDDSDKSIKKGSCLFGWDYQAVKNTIVYNAIPTDFPVVNTRPVHSELIVCRYLASEVKESGSFSDMTLCRCDH
ncbi:MAG: hypothetical protein V3T17_11230 [Pseudomonadales bacterium]